MRKILQEIEDGDFAREFLDQHEQTSVLGAREATGTLAQAGRRILPRLHPNPDQT